MNCARCGFPTSEHHYNGACYGVCGEFTLEREIKIETSFKQGDDMAVNLATLEAEKFEKRIEELAQEVAELRRELERQRQKRADEYLAAR